MSEEITLQVMYASKKLNMIFANNQVPLRFVAEEIAMQTDLPVKNQKLICKGHSLLEMDKSLAEHNIKNKSKLMVIGRKVTIEDDMNTGAMKNVEKHVKSCEKRITDIQQETTSIENGHLAERHHMEALKSLSKRVCVNIGDLTRYLESLDALSLVDSAPELRVRRKGLVTRIQTCLDLCDSTQTALNTLKDHIS